MRVHKLNNVEKAMGLLEKQKVLINHYIISLLQSTDLVRSMAVKSVKNGSYYSEHSCTCFRKTWYKIRELDRDKVYSDSCKIIF